MAGCKGCGRVCWMTLILNMWLRNTYLSFYPVFLYINLPVTGVFFWRYLEDSQSDQITVCEHLDGKDARVNISVQVCVWDCVKPPRRSWKRCEKAEWRRESSKGASSWQMKWVRKQVRWQQRVKVKGRMSGEEVDKGKQTVWRFPSTYVFEAAPMSSNRCKSGAGLQPINQVGNMDYRNIYSEFAETGQRELPDQESLQQLKPLGVVNGIMTVIDYGFSLSVDGTLCEFPL